MKTRFLAAIMCTFFFGCKTKVNGQIDTGKNTLIEKDFVVDSSYAIGDIRRYGVTPENAVQRDPRTGKKRLSTVLDLAELTGIEMQFPKGYYGTDLILDHRRNLRLRFNESEFNLIHITQAIDTLPKPDNIKLGGTLISYDRLGITEASNISIDTVYLRSNETLNLRGMKGRGCHIYHGSNNISIKYLFVEGFGSGDKKYQYNHAALALDGWNNNPKNVHIEEVVIKSTERHGIYLTGTGHYIGKATIKNFGTGDSKDMAPMQDAQKGEEKEFKAIWINKCGNTVIDSLIIDEKLCLGSWTAHFDFGRKTDSVVIRNFKIYNDNPKIEILNDAKHNTKVLNW